MQCKIDSDMILTHYPFVGSAQEERFKAQFSEHAKTQLKALALENTSQNSFAMNRELDRNFSCLIEKVCLMGAAVRRLCPSRVVEARPSQISPARSLL